MQPHFDCFVVVEITEHSKELRQNRRAEDNCDSDVNLLVLEIKKECGSHRKKLKAAPPKKKKKKKKKKQKKKKKKKTKKKTK